MNVPSGRVRNAAISAPARSIRRRPAAAFSPPRVSVPRAAATGAPASSTTLPDRLAPSVSATSSFRASPGARASAAWTQGTCRASSTARRYVSGGTPFSAYVPSGPARTRRANALPLRRSFARGTARPVLSSTTLPGQRRRRRERDRQRAALGQRQPHVGPRRPARVSGVHDQGAAALRRVRDREGALGVREDPARRRLHALEAHERSRDGPLAGVADRAGERKARREGDGTREAAGAQARRERRGEAVLPHGDPVAGGARLLESEDAVRPGHGRARERPESLRRRAGRPARGRLRRRPEARPTRPRPCPRSCRRAREGARRDRPSRRPRRRPRRGRERRPRPRPSRGRASPSRPRPAPRA